MDYSMPVGAPCPPVITIIAVSTFFVHFVLFVSAHIAARLFPFLPVVQPSLIRLLFYYSFGLASWLSFFFLLFLLFALQLSRRFTPSLIFSPPFTRFLPAHLHRVSKTDWYTTDTSVTTAGQKRTKWTKRDKRSHEGYSKKDIHWGKRMHRKVSRMRLPFISLTAVFILHTMGSALFWLCL